MEVKMKNNNQKVIRRLSNRSLKKNKMRNIFILIAISLTALLFTTLLSLGSGMIQSTEEQTMRQIGTRAHAGLKDVTMEQYEKMTSHPLVKDCSYNILIGMATNEELNKRQTEIRYTQAKDIEFGFVRLKEGKLPEKEDEIVVDSIVMDMLGIPNEIGEKMSLSYDFMGKKKVKTFTISGWYVGDPVSKASQVYLSRNYLDEISVNYTEEDFIEAKNRSFLGIGLIQGSIMFKNSNNIEGNMNTVIVESGYLVKDIEVGINWAYLTQMSQELDFMSTMIIIVAFLVMMLTGYLIIYNIFQISIIGDIRFYGLLKTIGATKKQIKRLVLRQAFLLSCFGIPIGLLLGYIVGDLILPLFLGISGGYQVSNFHIKANPYIFLFGALFSLMTVFISCRKPSKIAGGVSPIEAAKYSEASLVKRKTKKSKRGARLVSMALSNLKRNKKKTIITILSLSLSVILMTEVVTFSKSFSVDQYLETMLTGDFMISSISLMNYNSQEDMKVPEDFYEAVNSQEGIEGSSRMYCSEGRPNHILSDSGNRRFKEFYEKGMLKVYKGEFSNVPDIENVISNNSAISEQRYAYDDLLLDKLKVLEGTLDLDKFKTGNYILVVPAPDMDEAYYRPGDKVELQYHTTESVLEEVKDSQGNIINYSWAKDRVKEYEVMAVVDIPYSMTQRRFGVNALTTILPVEELLANDTDTECFAASYWVQDEKEAAFQGFLESYTTKVNPNTDFESKEGLRDEIATMSMTINLVGGALSLIVGIIGIINFINTMLTSVITRKREFAMMQSIGLTNKQLKRMLIYEGIYYIGYTAVISIMIGSLLSASVIRAFNKIVQCFEYQFSILPFVALLPVFLLVGLMVPMIAYRKSMKQSMVERLREE
jgi:putative ABC transport system permease protein